VPYFLDGNNLIGLVRRTARPGEDDRSALIAEISERLRHTRSSVRLFFDGPAGRQTGLGRLTVTDAGGSADEAILRGIADAKDPGAITVVTADRELSRRVRDAGGRTMAPNAFWARFGASGVATSRPEGSPVDVDEWMGYFADPKNRTD
jgi:predicted RNA-binding protein with PIN domain